MQASRQKIEQLPNHGLSGAKVLIADDHLLFRRGFKLLLATLFPGVESIGADDAPKAFQKLTNTPDVSLIFLDLGMPGMNGLQTVRQFVEHVPSVPVIILSAHTEPGEILECIRIGARAYIPKSADEVVVKNALNLVLAGETFIPSLAIQQIKLGNNHNVVHQLADLPGDNPLRQLTKRQCDTLALIVEGRSNKEIARQLGLLESTVKAHVKAILKKLAAQNRTQAALIANDLGWPRISAAHLS